MLTKTLKEFVDSLSTFFLYSMINELIDNWFLQYIFPLHNAGTSSVLTNAISVYNLVSFFRWIVRIYICLVRSQSFGLLIFFWSFISFYTNLLSNL